jgi:hypothetical protein
MKVLSDSEMSSTEGEDEGREEEIVEVMETEALQEQGAIPKITLQQVQQLQPHGQLAKQHKRQMQSQQAHMRTLSDPTEPKFTVDQVPVRPASRYGIDVFMVDANRKDIGAAEFKRLFNEGKLKYQLREECAQPLDVVEILVTHCKLTERKDKIIWVGEQEFRKIRTGLQKTPERVEQKKVRKEAEK